MVRGQQYKDGPYRQWPEFWPGNRSNDSIVTQFADRAADAIRNLHPDQPADAGEPDKSVSLRQQISEAQETVAAWPKWMTRSAKVHEPWLRRRAMTDSERDRLDDLKALLRQPVKAQDLMDPKTGRPMDNADAADALDARDAEIKRLREELVQALGDLEHIEQSASNREASDCERTAEAAIERICTALNGGDDG
jgi:hypothetical protein